MSLYHKTPCRLFLQQMASFPDFQLTYSMLSTVANRQKQNLACSPEGHSKKAGNPCPKTRLNRQNSSSACNLDKEGNLTIRRVAIYDKTTRYEFEKQRFGYFRTEEEFKDLITSKGSSYEALLNSYLKHTAATNRIKSCLAAKNIAYRVYKRLGLADKDMDKAMDWADAVITTGGDGTFLSAASKVKSRNKPFIGVNTRPQTSEGHLCISPYYSDNFDKALDLISQNKFKWLFRKRIRVTMNGQPSNFIPLQNSDVLPEIFRRRSPETTSAIHPVANKQAVLPALALNEVFIGESLSSIPSDYDIRIDDGEWEKQKSSGVCISTGTGSTAWSFSIISLHQETVRRVLQAAQDVGGEVGLLSDNGLVEKITERLKKSSTFDPSANKLLVSVRDPIQNHMFTCKSPHQFATKVSIRSRCWDATLCIDGHTSFTFDDGAIITLEMVQEDDLRTISLSSAHDDETPPPKARL